MATIDLHEEKADYLEFMSSLLATQSICCAIAYGDPDVIDIIHPYHMSADKDHLKLKKAIENCTVELKNFLSAKSENLSVFFEMQWKDLQVTKSGDRKSLTILANLNIALSQIYKTLSEGCKLNENEEYELWNIEQEILLRSNREIGYWAAKMENYRIDFMRTKKSTDTKRDTRNKHKVFIKLSALKMANQFSLTTVRRNISEAVFVNMIKDDLSSLKMSEKKIKTLLHELQDEGEIKFDPRKAKPGKM